MLGLGISLFTPRSPVTGADDGWILAFGAWRDSGTWIDTDNWRDS